MFGSTGTCAGCGQTIPPSEMVLRACTGGQTAAVYHVQCFSCAACHCRLVAGDKYRIVNGHIICGDHELPQPHTAPGGKQQHHSAVAVQIPPSPVAAAGRLAGATIPASSGSSHGARSRQKVGSNVFSPPAFIIETGHRRQINFVELIPCRRREADTRLGTEITYPFIPVGVV